MIFQRIKVERHTKRRADLVVTAIPFSDRARVVKIHVELFTQGVEHFFRLFIQFFGQRQNRRLDGSQCRMQMQNHTFIVLFGVYDFFVVSIAENGQESALHAE